MPSLINNNAWPKLFERINVTINIGVIRPQYTRDMFVVTSRVVKGTGRSELIEPVEYLADIYVSRVFY